MASVIEEVKAAQQLIHACPRLLWLLDHPALSLLRKRRLLAELFADEVSPRALRVLQLMGSAWLAKPFSFLQAEVRTPQPLRMEQFMAIRALLIHRTGRRVCLRVIKDTSLIAGIQVRCGGMVLDGSLCWRLERLRTQLKEG